MSQNDINKAIQQLLAHTAAGPDGISIHFQTIKCNTVLTHLLAQVYVEIQDNNNTCISTY